MSVIEYRVRYGDTLASISQAIYGSPDFASVIYQHNRHEIQNINQLYPGQIICLPRINRLSVVVPL